MPDPLHDAVQSFVSATTRELAALTGRPPSAYLADATVEAANVAAAVIAADERLSDAELDGYLDSIGPLLDPPLITTAGKLRETDMMAGKRHWLAAPSVMFDLLAKADGRDGTYRSHRYYETALRLCHVVAALDLVPSPGELAVIDDFRTIMLRHMDAAGVSRPGQPAPVPVAGTGPRAPLTAASAVAPVAAPTETPRSLADLLGELDQLIGLANVKTEVRRLTSLLQVQQIRKERHLPVMETSHHLVFTGNPGTGKTTVARLMSQIYRTIGVVAKGQLVETDRSKLVAGFVGQTAIKTQQALESSLGGMLLIDEAYALARGGENDFGLEAIDTLVKFMEDHRDDLAIVAAGYPREMADFIDTNPGLKSRFTRTILFPDYNADELVQIFTGLGDKNQYLCTDDALSAVRHLIEIEPRTRGFGNARFVRNLFETAVSHQAMRLSALQDPSDEQLTTLTADDIAPVDA